MCMYLRLGRLWKLLLEPQLSQMDVLVEFVVSSARTLKSCGEVSAQCSKSECISEFQLCSYLCK